MQPVGLKGKSMSVNTEDYSQFKMIPPDTVRQIIQSVKEISNQLNELHDFRRAWESLNERRSDD